MIRNIYLKLSKYITSQCSKLLAASPIDLHYMTDRLQRFELNIFVCVLLKKQSHLHLGCPGGVNYPFNDYKGVTLEYFHTHTDLIDFFYQIALTALKYETPKFLWFRTQKRTHAYSKTVLFPIWVYVYAFFLKG